MGMFDTLTCEYPLPIEGANGLGYQTKDLDSTLDVFKISASGLLLKQHAGWTVERFSGCLWFYTTIEPRGWLEWRAHFESGQMVGEPHLVEHTLPDGSPATAGENEEE